MKRLVLTLTATLVSIGAFAQGTMLTIDNLNGTGNNHATSLGLFFNADGTPYSSGTLNVTLLGGAAAASLAPVATVSMMNLTPGVWIDSTFGTYDVAGVAPGAVATLQVRAWRGAANGYNQAAGTDQFWAWDGAKFVSADTHTFTQATGGGGVPVGLPKSLDGMPAMQLQTAIVPEPTTLAFAGLGVAALLLYRRRNS